MLENEDVVIEEGEDFEEKEGIEGEGDVHEGHKCDHLVYID